jgi:D-glycero-D-manno-heptose 1,7-bisphosphate phosphatase|tara:strand:- start:10 stop:519 length:510 start_codon:yes stop_codon:yes gene_type:complete
MKINKFKNIFLDRDGIVNDVILRDDIVSSPRSLEEFKFRDDFLNFAKKIDKNHNFFLVTNQPDVKRKLLKLDDLQNMHDQLMNILPFKKLFVCVHDDEDNCSCRKPKPGMILEAISTNNLKHNECIMIGDSIKDVQSANSAGISTLLLDTNYNTHIIFNNKIQSLISLI